MRRLGLAQLAFENGFKTKAVLQFAKDLILK
jgi:hypothetical protein